MAVRKDCGLKKPGSQTEEGRLKSEVQLSVKHDQVRSVRLVRVRASLLTELFNPEEEVSVPG